MNGESILRGLVLVLFVPAIGAATAHVIGHPSIAMALNGVVPMLVLIASALAILNAPHTEISVGGAMYFAIPVVVLLACSVGLRLRRLHAALFWTTWALNLAIVTFLFYLSFLFKIF